MPNRATDRMLYHGAVFSRIYRLDVWGGSGTGSREGSTIRYRRLLQKLLADRNVRRVIDLGCGDWSFSRLLDWSGIDYVGIDVVPWLIRQNRRLYARDNIHFEVMDLQRSSLPQADLYLLKDVLQHWTGAEITTFFRRMTARTMLITNSVTPTSYRELDEPGGFRPLDIRRPPFGVRAQQLLRYRCTPRDVKVAL